MFAIMVASLYEDCQPNILLNYLAGRLYYSPDISVVNFTYTQTLIFTVLRGAGITDPSILNQMWFDPVYGFKAFSGFVPWVRMGYTNLKPGQLSNLARHLMGYFSVSYDNMMALVGTNNTWIYNVSYAEHQHLISVLNETESCSNKMNCTSKELCQLQWGKKKLTRLIDSRNINSYSDLNVSIPLIFEIAQEDPLTWLDLATSKRLLSMYTNGTQTNEPTSLLNFTNVQKLVNNLNNTSLIQSTFSLTVPQAIALSAYYNNSMNSMRVASNSPQLSYFRARFSRDGLLNALSYLDLYVFNNVTMKAFAQRYSDQKATYSCQNYFTASYAERICSNNLLSLDNYNGIILWVIAVYQDNPAVQSSMQDINAIEQIAQALNIEAEKVRIILNTSIVLQNQLVLVQNDIKSQLGCFEAPCDRKYLSQLQFYSSEATYWKPSNISSKYPIFNVYSIAQFKENEPLLDNKVPEILGFYNIHFGYTGKVFGGEQDIVFNNGQGSIVNYFQFFLLYQFSKNNRTSDIAHTFNIWSPPSYFGSFGDHLLFEFYFGGIVKQISYQAILYGYNDSAVLAQKQLPELRGGIPTADPFINYRIFPSVSVPLKMNTGNDSNFEQRGQIYSYNYTSKISYKGKSVWPVPDNINGTLALFSVPLSNNQNISVFYPEQFRNIIFEPGPILRTLQFKVNNFTWSSSNFQSNTSSNSFDSTVPGINNLTRVLNISQVVSLPYFSNVPNASNSQYLPPVYLQNRPLQQYTSIYPLPHLETERFTGLTLKASIPLMVGCSD